jgi:DNA-binding MarR family transcriptional regulator
MPRNRSSEIREDIAAALDLGAALLSRRVAQGRGLSLAARGVLGSLEEAGPTRLTALAAASGVSQPAMTQLVGRLERDGLVVRLIDPDDARATLVDLTDAGHALLAELRRLRRDRLAQLLDTLPPHDEVTLSLAMRVALPLLQQLSSRAAEHPHFQPAPETLTGDLAAPGV